MPNIENLTLSKALSVKNRLAGRLAQARSNIETYNSVLAGQRDDYGKATVDVRAEYERIPQAPGWPDRRQGGHPAGQPADLRGHPPARRAQERDPDARRPEHQARHGARLQRRRVPVHRPTILKPEVLEMVRRLEAEIDAIQDKLNQFNASTRIEIPGGSSTWRGDRTHDRSAGEPGRAGSPAFTVHHEGHSCSRCRCRINSHRSSGHASTLKAQRSHAVTSWETVRTVITSLREVLQDFPPLISIKHDELCPIF